MASVFRTAAATFMLFGAAEKAQAYEPPNRSVSEALAEGQRAFIGRVVSLREHRRTDLETLARARFSITQCLYGASCKPGSVVELEYVLDSADEEARTLGVPWGLGEHYLLIMKGASRQTPWHFDSSWADGIDISFSVRGLEDAGPDGEVRFANIWLPGKVEHLHWPDLEKWAAMRREQLKTNRRQ